MTPHRRNRFVLVGATLGLVFIGVLLWHVRPGPTRPVVGSRSTPQPRLTPGFQPPARVLPRESPPPRRSSMTSTPPRVIRGSVVGGALLRNFVEALRQETPAESVRRLDQVHPYFWPGAHLASPRMLDLARPGMEKYLVETILSNRRFLKVLSDLGKLPKAQASALVAQGIQETLPDYERAVMQQIATYANLAKATPDASGLRVGVSFQVDDNPDGTPSYPGLRLKLLALSLAAGTQGLQGARPEILQLTRLALDQQAQLRDPNFLDEEYRGDFIFADGIYCTRILATALIGTSPGGWPPAASRADQTPQWRRVTMPVFDAAATPFDLRASIDPADAFPGTPTASPDATPPGDYTKGALTIEIHEMMSDSEFNRLVEEATTR